jgi:hypothetical protein
LDAPPALVCHRMRGFRNCSTVFGMRRYQCELEGSKWLIHALDCCRTRAFRNGSTVFGTRQYQCELGELHGLIPALYCRPVRAFRDGSTFFGTGRYQCEREGLHGPIPALKSTSSSLARTSTHVTHCNGGLVGVRSSLTSLVLQGIFF